MNSFIEKLSGIVWGPGTILILSALGIFLSVGCKFPQVVRFGTILKKTLGSLFKAKKKTDGISPFKAMSTALGGTIGTGNIAGVATAIAAGGAGAIFWMWCSAFFGMMTKFAEVTLAVHFRETENGVNKGGPMYYIIRGLGNAFYPLSACFSVLCVFASFGIGNMAQVHAISTAAAGSMGIPHMVTGIVVALLVTLVIMGGVKSITSFTGIFVPFMALFYIFGACAVIFFNRENLLSALSQIFGDAFGIRQAAGGISGYALSRALRYGVSRGVFTNEAGMGSAPIAHATADTKEPVEQGLWGVMEVFLDTIVVCTLTALAILTSKTFISGSALNGTELTSAAFSELFGKSGPIFISVAILLFAFASIISWAFYGQMCLEFLFPRHSKTAVTIYRLAFFAALIIGSVAGVQVVWSLSDVLNGLMAIPNIIALFLLSPIVFRLTKEYFSRGIRLKYS